MYDLYLEGHSLAKVARHFGVTRQAVYKMFNRRGWPLRPRPKPLPFVVFKEERYTIMVGGYYRKTRKTRGNRSYLHQDIWEDAYGPIPEGHDIHHKDGDKTNNTLSNLECLAKADHTRLHNQQRKDSVGEAESYRG